MCRAVLGISLVMCNMAFSVSREGRANDDTALRDVFDIVGDATVDVQSRVEPRYAANMVAERPVALHGGEETTLLVTHFGGASMGRLPNGVVEKAVQKIEGRTRARRPNAATGNAPTQGTIAIEPAKADRGNILLSTGSVNSDEGAKWSEVR